MNRALIAQIVAAVAIVAATANMFLSEQRIRASKAVFYGCGFLAAAEVFADGSPKLPEYCVVYRDEAAAGGFHPKHLQPTKGIDL